MTSQGFSTPVHLTERRVVNKAEGLLTIHIELKLTVQIPSDSEPAVYAKRHLLEVKDIVPRWPVTITIEVELVPA